MNPLKRTNKTTKLINKGDAKMNTKVLENMTTAEKLQELNAILTNQGKKPLKRWSKSTAALDERLKAERGTSEASEPNPDDNNRPKSKRSSGLGTDKPVANRTRTKGRAVSIAERCRVLIAEGLSNSEIHARLLKLGEAGQLDYDASKKYYPAWYRGYEKRQAAKAQ